MENETVVTPEVAVVDETPKAVSYEDHKRALDDMHKFKARAAQLEKEQKALRDQDLRQREQWKQLAETKEQEAKAAQERAAQIERSFLNERKFSTLKEEAMRLGLRPEAMSDLELLDMEELQIETTNTGKINVVGAKTYAERVKTLKPHWFQPAQVQVNGSAPRVSADVGPITAKDVYAAEKQYRSSGKPEDHQRYSEMVLKYRKQGTSR